jgi:protein TonB
MNNLSVYEELDQAIDQMLHPQLASPSFPQRARNGWGPQKRRDPGAPPQTDEGNIRELVELARNLRDLPRANFQTRLRLELEWESAGRAVSAPADAYGNRAAKVAQGTTQILPSLFGKRWAGYPMRRINFVASVGIHAVMAFLVGAGFLMVKNSVPSVDRGTSVTVRLEPYRAPIGLHANGGGGSGGGAEKLRASKGAAPTAKREQLTPPIVLEQQQRARLVAEPSVIAPPDLTLPRTRQVGDPLSALATASNGPGVGGGFGGNTGDGVGTGRGPGRGNGRDGGCCEGVYEIGNGVSMPRAIYSPEPEFSEEARKTKHQGDVILLALIGADGRPRNLTIVRSLGMGLDEKALEKVSTWRFEPAKKDGHPVAVQMNIIVNFRLY